ncbi:metallophosphoesterase [Halorubrum sp. JWXQ-INN 858]|uniref:metallophosphoesterase family protein n=1 Tax=Halorubrum sp. JWXQ-INN 858 TaxID=2690782 RepID=UPI001358D6EB|nr:metallophosphoesterase family protein [Halorubrum sp. JWXQ-INN 858]MWV64952.1 metallophosphoesterase [Halorubrum sp. JWXQ-INN 858]
MTDATTLGLIADVHANLPALEAVLEDMPPVDAVVCAGDVVGYNPWPAACVERVREVASVTVRGNHDGTVERPERYRGNRMAEAGLEHALATLSERDLAWLRGLPRTARIADGRFLLVHSHPSPEREDAYVYPEEFAALDRHLEAVDGVGDRGGLDGAVLGHTHVQAARRTRDGRLVINPGSVGQPRDGDPDAAYAVLTVGDDREGVAGDDRDGPERSTRAADAAVDLRRVAYDVDRVARAVADAGLPERTAARLYEGA